MPPFATASGGMLTSRQIEILAQGTVASWGKPASVQGQTVPSYASAAAGDPSQGEKSFATFCARCHASDSLTDPAYLSLISDQALRSIVIAGQPEQGMPDWRADQSGSDARAMTDREVTDIVAWLASKRTTAPGAPYMTRP